MKIAGIIISVCAGVLLLLLMTVYITYCMAFRVNKKKKIDPFYGTDGEENPLKSLSREYISRLLEVPYESVYIKSFDGLTLHARYYHARDGAPLEIQCHGYRSVSTHDFSGGAIECMKMGYNLLLIDQRAHGDSEGNSISFGINERFDVLSWIEYANSRFGTETEMLLYGISMGAASVLMAGELALPENVVGIVADCPYSSPKEIICKVMREMHFPSTVFYPLTRLGAKIFGGFDLEAASPISAAENIKIPVLIIHGEGDGFVPCDMSRKISEGHENITLKTFPEAGHGLCFIYDHDGYMEAVNSFHERVLKNGDKHK